MSFDKDLSIYELPTALNIKGDDYLPISRNITTRRASNKVSYNTILDSIRKEVLINENTVKLVNQYIINNQTLSTQKDLNIEVLRLLSKFDKSKLIFYTYEFESVVPNTQIQAAEGSKVYSINDYTMYVVKNQRLTPYELNEDTLYIYINDLNNTVFKKYVTGSGLVKINIRFENDDYVSKHENNIISDSFSLSTNLSTIKFNHKKHGFYSYLSTDDFVQLTNDTLSFGYVLGVDKFTYTNNFGEIKFTKNGDVMKVRLINEKYFENIKTSNFPETIHTIYNIKINDTYSFANEYGSLDLSDQLTDENTKITNVYENFGVIKNQKELNDKIVSLISEMKLNKSFINTSLTQPTLSDLNRDYPSLNPGDSIYYTNLSLPKKFVYLGNNDFTQEIFVKMT